MMFFFPEFRVYFQQCCDADRHQAAGHYDKEEVEVSHGFLQFSGHAPGSIMDRAMKAVQKA